MKLKNVILIILLQCSILLTCHSQEKPSAKLISEMSGLDPCGETLAVKLDDFALELQANLNALGYIVINGDKRKPHEKYFQEGRIRRRLSIQFPDLLPDRILFLHGDDTDKFGLHFWITPTATGKPDYSAAEWSYVLPKITKPQLTNIQSKYSDAGEVCFTLIDNQTYARFLLANPNLLGRVVIYADSVKSFNQVSVRVLEELTSHYKISTDQLRILYKKSRKNNQVREFWLVPKRENRKVYKAPTS